MGFNFPSSPTAGQTFQPAGGPLYTYQGGVWQLSGGAGLIDAPLDGHEYARKNATWVDVNQMRSGAGAPAAALGDIGDYYINSATVTDATSGTIYGPKAAGSLAAAVRTLGTKNPAAGEDTSGSPWYFGNRFTVVVDGLITKLWAYKSATSTSNGTQIHLWRITNGIRLLWSGTITTIGSAGWYSVDIPGGIWLSATSKFSVVAQILTNGKFGSTGVQTSDSPATLTIDGATDGDGASYPSTLYNNANFWTDVSFATGPNIWPLADQPLLDAPYGVTYGRGNGFWVPVTTPATQGVFKISESAGPGIGAGQIDIALPTGYKSYELTFNGLYPATDATSMAARFSLDDGATYKAGATDYGWTVDTLTMIAASGWSQIGNPSTQWIIFAYLQGNVPTSAGHFKLFIPVAQAGAVQRMDWHGSYRDTRTTPVPPFAAGGVQVQVRGIGIFLPIAGRATNIRILASAGNFNYQSWQLNGIA